MAGIEEIFAEIWRGAAGQAARSTISSTQIFGSYADLPADERRSAAARDVIVIHMGSQSNLYAALAWTLVNLVLQPELLARVRDGDDGSSTGAPTSRSAWPSGRSPCARCSSRSRWTPGRAPTGSSRGAAHHHAVLPQHHRRLPGSTASTRPTTGPAPLPRVALPPGRWSAPSATGSTLPGGPLLHLGHRWPRSVGLLERYELPPGFTKAAPRRRQIGGVARAARPCPVAYRSDGGRGPRAAVDMYDSTPLTMPAGSEDGAPRSP